MKHKLVLNGLHGEGDSQRMRSKAGWVGFASLDAASYLMFVGGVRFGEKQGWFYRYRTDATPPLELAYSGPFDGTLASTHGNPWGPQSGVAMLHDAAGMPSLISFGSKGAEGFDAFRSEMRCFSVLHSEPLPPRLVHEPRQQSAVYRFPKAGLRRPLRQNARWGVTAFVDARNRLLTYFTARNPRPGRGKVHVLEISEVRRHS